MTQKIAKPIVSMKYDNVPCDKLGYDTAHLFIGVTDKGLATLMVLPDDNHDNALYEYHRLMDSKVTTATLTHDPQTIAPYVQGFKDFLNGADMPDFKLDLYGTPFQQAVWQELLAIPMGTLDIYGEMTTRVAKRGACAKNAYRAVGSAIGQNPVSILVPCHRVVHKNPQTMNYRWGVAVKQALQTRENTNPKTLYHPNLI